MNSRAPKQLGDFGEGLVTYALIRKGFEVACVDHVGADLICEKDGDRLAVSVKTRLFREGSRESRDFSLDYAHIEKLEHFAARFNLIPIIAHVASVADDGRIHLFMVRISDAKRFLKRGKHGFRLNFSKTKIEETITLPYIDYSCWSGEAFGDDLSCLLSEDNEPYWPLPTPLAVRRLLSIGGRFSNERSVEKETYWQVGPIVQLHNLHPAAESFMSELDLGKWIMDGWNYCPWAEENQNNFEDPEWISGLSLREIQQYLTWYSRKLRNGSGCPEVTVSNDIAAGILPALVERLDAVQEQAF